MKEEYRPLYEKFGLNVVYYRKRKRLTQLQLAELADVDRSHISAIELGEVGVSFDVIFKLCEVLDLILPSGRTGLLCTVHNAKFPHTAKQEVGLKPLSCFFIFIQI